jgi:hypothetical protein
VSLAIEPLKARYLALVKAHELRPITALVQLLSCGKELAVEQQQQIEGALLHGEAISQETLPALEELLASWQEKLGEPAPKSSKKRKG